MEVEDENCVTQKPQMRGNEKKERIEDLEVKVILILELQMMNKLLNNNLKSVKLVFFNEIDHEVHNQESMIEINVLVVSTNSADVFKKLLNIWGY